MGKEIPRSFERLRNGEQLQPPTFTNVAAAVAAGVTAAKFPRRIIYHRDDYAGNGVAHEGGRDDGGHGVRQLGCEHGRWV